MNKLKYSAIMILLICFLANTTDAQSFQNEDTSIVADGATPQLISKQFSFTEGPAADKYGNVFFTDQPNNKIWKYGTDGKLSIFMDSAGRSNGMDFDKKGNLVSCADEHNELWSIAPDKKVTILLSGINGRLLNGPNDVWVAPNGGIYFTDPLYKRNYWKTTSERVAGEKVYYLARNKKMPVVVDSVIKKPNGIVGSSDGKLLYVADIGGGKTYKYTINKDGTLADRKLFAELGSDGMTIDDRGNVYLTGHGVTVYNKDGMQIKHIDIPANWTANVCFGGKNRDQLFITASEAVYTLNMKVKGAQ